jgi:hypothetical protein
VLSVALFPLLFSETEYPAKVFIFSLMVITALVIWGCVVGAFRSLDRAMDHLVSTGERKELLADLNKAAREIDKLKKKEL